MAKLTTREKLQKKASDLLLRKNWTQFTDEEFQLLRDATKQTEVMGTTSEQMKELAGVIQEVRQAAERAGTTSQEGRSPPASLRSSRA